jgi:hypothetical protein
MRPISPPDTVRLIRSYEEAPVEPAPALRSSGGRPQLSPSSSPVKKAWIAEHRSGSVPVNVYGYVNAEPEPSPRKVFSNDPYTRQKHAIDFMQAQDLAELKRREAELEKQREDDEVRLLQLQHETYSLQNSPHQVRQQEEINEEEYDGTTQQQQWNGHHQQQQQQQQTLEPEYEDAEEYASTLPPPRPFGTQAVHEQHFYSPSRGALTQYQLLSASSNGRASQPPASSPSRHVIGDEHGLNASFSRTEEQTVEQGGAFDAQRRQRNSQQQLKQINEQLSHIADRNNFVAQRVADGSAKKKNQDREAYEQQLIPSVQYQAHNSFQQAPSQPSPSSAAGVSSLLSSVAPALSTPLENRLFQMLEQIQSKVVAMENRTRMMESKLAEVEAKPSAPPVVRASIVDTGRAGLDLSQRSVHPVPAVPASRAEAPLVPHPAHAYTPGAYFSRVQPAAPVAPPAAPVLSQAYPHLSTAPLSSYAPVSPARGSTAAAPDVQSANSTTAAAGPHAARPSSGSFPHSTLAAAHPIAGSAQLSSELLPSTDSFIEGLKARLRQTEDLIHTARVSARVHAEFNPTSAVR